MKIRILGTGTSQGVPVIGCDCDVCQSTDERDKRLRVSVLLNKGGKNIIIDTGPDFRQQILAAKIKTLEAILLTHEHNDHIIGIDDVRSFIFMQKKAMPVFADERVILDLKKRFSYAFKANPYPGSPRFDVNDIDNDSNFSINSFNINAVRIWHGNLSILGFKIDKFAYLTDIKTIEDHELEKVKGVDVLIISALQIRTHHSHANLEEALEIIDKIQANKTFITHISHRMGRHELIEKKLPENVFLAYDGLELEV